jgi:ribonuclease G
MSALLPIDEILFSASPGETRAALVADGRLIELLVEREASAGLVGNVYLGRVGKLMPSMEAAFVELGTPRAGFLARAEARTPLDAEGRLTRPREQLGSGTPLGRIVSEGEAILVQVTKDATGSKGPRLSTQIALPGHWLVYGPGHPGLAVSRRITDGAERARLEAVLAPQLAPGEGVILRTAAEGVEGVELLDDLVVLRKQWQALLARARAARAPALLLAEPDPIARVLRDHAGPALRRVFCDSREARGRAAAFLARHGAAAAIEVSLHQGTEPLFARHEVEAQIAAALEPEVALPSGGRLVIGTLEALTAIDVDTARHAGTGRFEDTVLAVNLEAAAEIARQVRLRNIAGLIVVDFVHMDRPGDRARVADAMRAAFAADPVAVQLGGMTPLGLYEMTRKRVRESLRDQLTAPCDACHGAGRLKSAVTVAYELLRAAARAAEAAAGRELRVVAAPAVAAALDGEARPARLALEARLGRPLLLSAEPGYGRERFDILAG